MSSNLFKSKALLFGGALVAVAAAGLLGCTLEPYILTSEELYTRNFIKDFGLIDPNQDWNLAKEATVTVNLGDAVHKSVKIYGNVQGKYYLVADLTDISGRLDVPVDVPESTTDFMVVTNGRKYYGGLASPIDCSEMSRGVPNGNDYTEDTNTNPAVYEATKSGYSVMVQHTNKGNGAASGYGTAGDEYQYFNTQQMSPLIATTPWEKYYSLNTGGWSKENINGDIGLLPESGEFNRKKSVLEQWITQKRDEGKTIVEDFKITTGDDGSFTLFPYYYGTNLVHELGVYLLDDKGNPILADGSEYNSNIVSSNTLTTLDKFVYFPVFRDREAGDLQVQPHYDSRIKDIMLSWGGENPEGNKFDEYTFTIDEKFELEKYVYINLENIGWVSYSDYLTKYDGNQTHSRVAYHFWVDEVFNDNDPKPVTHATCTRDGVVTPLASTTGEKAWASIGIAYNLKVADKGAGKGFIEGRECTLGYYVTEPAVHQHSYTEEFTALPATMTLDDDWNCYFEPSDYFENDVTDKLNCNVEKYGATTLPASAFTDVDDTYSIVISIDPANRVFLAYGNWSGNFEGEYTYMSNGTQYTSSDSKTQVISTFEVPVQNWMIARLKENGLLIHAPENAFTITKLALKRPLKVGEIADTWTWTSNGKANAISKLKEYYKDTNPGTQNCDCDKSIDFSNADMQVVIPADAGHDKIHYFVKWTLGNTSANARRRNAPAQTRHTGSRDSDSGSRPSFLNANGTWMDVNTYWSRYLPDNDEVASYPTNMTMLARSRGYDIKIMVEDGQGNKVPYKGSLGMYLKVIGAYEIDNDGNEQYSTTKSMYQQTFPYVVFSQKKFNRAANGEESEQISALSVKHPVTERTFLTFEDMRVTRNGVTPDQYWEYSSDRDVNDLIFNISNYGSISNDKEEISEKTNDEAISWLWAVEDLGSTDDFDFNDMVMKITSVTGNRITKDQDGKESKVELYKKVTFQPLCAGGTLPLYVQYTKDGKTYTLKPGVFKEEDLDYEGDEFKEASDISDIQIDGSAADDESEIHRWFGDGTYPSTSMINTNGEKIKSKTCVLYLKDGFSIAGFGSGSKKGPQGGLTVYVRDDRGQQDYTDITDGKDDWTISTPDPGKVSQMFMIYDAKTPWRWPTERTHILEAYPDFKEWVKDGNNEEWYKVHKGNTCPRYDLGE